MTYRKVCRVGSALTLASVVVALAALMAMLPARCQASDPALGASDRHARTLDALGRLPTAFEENRGQTDPRVKFLSHGVGEVLFLTPDEAVLEFSRAISVQARRATAQSAGAVIRIRLEGSRSNPGVEGLDRMDATANYFTTNDPKRWRTDVANYARVKYEEVYPGIDLVYRAGGAGRLEFDFELAPEADPARIALRFSGADRLDLNAGGDLMIRTRAGDLVERAPVTYQVIDGARRQIASGYVIRDGVAGFKVAEYDHTRPLIIDPQQLVYATYLGGSGSEQAFGVAVDSAGNAYVAGLTLSSDFPTSSGAFLGSCPTALGSGVGCSTAFVAKLAPFASGAASLVYATYLGGSGGDQANGIAVDGSGNAYVVGNTQSSDFPVTPKAYKQQCGPPPSSSSSAGQCSSGFVTKLNSAGNKCLYSTYLGGSGGDQAHAIAVDHSGKAYVAGQTSSMDFPTKRGVESKCPTASSSSSGTGCSSGFMAELNPALSKGSSLVYSTYLGGKAGGDEAFAIAVNGAGQAYVTGVARSGDFPSTGGAFQKKCPTGVFATSTGTGARALNRAARSGTGTGSIPSSSISSSTPSPCNAAFVTEIDPSKSGRASLVYSTFLGGGGGEEGFGIAVDGSGHAYVSGLTNSTNFPVTGKAFQSTCPSQAPSSGLACDSGFVAKINPGASGKSSLVYATYLGGSNADQADAIAVDSSGNAYVTGVTTSADFQITPGAFEATCPTPAGGCAAAFFAKLAPSKAGSASLLYSTFLGGSGGDEARAIAVDGAGDAYLGGQASSIDFPATSGAFQSTCPSAVTSLASCSSAFVTVIATLPGTLSAPVKLAFGKVRHLKSKSSKLTIKNSGKGLLAGSVGPIQGQNSPFSITAGSGPFVLKPNQTKPVTVEFAPPTAGSFPDAFTISVTQTTVAPPSPAQQTIKLTGTGG